MPASQSRPIEFHSSFQADRSHSSGPQRPAALRLHPTGSQIYAPGQEATGHYVVKFGAVRIYRLLMDGRRQISAFHLAGEAFGLEHDGARQFFAEAICATGLMAVPGSVSRESPQDLLRIALDGMLRAQQHLLVVGRQNAMEQLGAFLLDMVDRQGGLSQIDVPMSRQDMGDYLGLTIETVSRTLTRFKESGAIRLHSLRSMEVCQPDVLRALCN